ncbi:MAG: leucine-rich repeat protein, partial [Candidatus Methanomethylophilaceae archaeon]|nr:leucine-rich repeat protein [Candidatus Methanomethylophilaceae archaeon]
MSSVLKASLFTVVVLAVVSSYLVVFDSEPVEGGGAGTSFSDGGLEYSIKDDGTAEVAGLDDQSITEMTVPSSVTYDSVTYDVSSIGDFVFFDCASLTSLTMPDSVTYIGALAF